MIVTAKVLGLRTADQRHVAAAARQVALYVTGGTPEQSLAARYYARDQARGHARGSGADLVGLRGEVAPEQLQRILMGRHAVTGRALLPASGSSGRVDRGADPAGNDGAPGNDATAHGEVLTLAQAAALAGVHVTHLQRLARNTARDRDNPQPRLISDGRGRRPARLEAFWDPEKSRWLVHRREVRRFIAERDPPTVVMGFDVTASAPKSVSLLWAFGDEELRASICAALTAGIDAAITHLERHATVGMVERRNRPGLGLAVASYLHEVSRSDEAHLHLHNIVANAVAVPVLDDAGHPVRDADGLARVEWRALDGELFLSHVKTAGYVGAAAMRHELTRLRGVAWGPVRNGVAEIAAFPPELLAAFSTRAGEVREEYAHLVAQGLLPGGATGAAAQRGSRAAKKVLADAEVRQIQRRRLADAGWTPKHVRALGARRERVLVAPTRAERAELADLLFGLAGLTAREAAFGIREATQAVAAWAGDRLPADAIGELAEEILGDPRAVLISEQGRRRRQRERTYTSVNLLESEDSLITLYQQGRADHGGQPRVLVPADAVNHHLAAGSETAPRPDDQDGPSPALTGEQDTLVRQVLASPDLVRLVIGAAGTGKTTTMRAVTRILTASGYQVLGAAHGGRQTEDLAAAVGIPARVVAGWLTLLDHADDPTVHWPAGTVLIVDEASQVSTRDAERLLRYATRTGTVVIMVGDPAQLGAIGAGGWFPHLISMAGTVPRLDTVHRQVGPGMASVRAALSGLRSQVPDEAARAVDLLAQAGHVQVHDDRDALFTAIVDDWYRDRASPGRRPAGEPARMLAERQRDIDALNSAARLRLVADGTLTGPALTVAGRTFQAGDEVITLTQAGHTLIPLGRHGRDYIRTGTVGTVQAVHREPGRSDRGHLTVDFPGRGQVQVGPDFLTHVFADGRDGGLGHAYAITAHKSQGTTMTGVRAAVTDDTSRAGLYVMLSRARRDLRAYLIRRPDLEADLDDEQWLPIIPPDGTAMDRLGAHLRASRTERLARDLDPIAQGAHQVATTRTLAELAQLRDRRAAPPDEQRPVEPHVLRRAELAAEASLAGRAVLAPPSALRDRIGDRPAAGPDRQLWDTAVSALAIYHARHAPDAAADQPGPPPPAGDDPAADWQRLHDQAHGIAQTWAQGLPPDVRRRFHAKAESIPRSRAVAGIHALLDAGWNGEKVAGRLRQREQTTVRAAAAVLDHRVNELCRMVQIDPAGYELPPPRTAIQDWAHLVDLLDRAEISHLARQPTSELVAVVRLVTSRGGPDPSVADRIRRAEEALTRQLDLAMVHLDQEPAAYLVGVLGRPPRSDRDRHAWRDRARTIEDYRHRTLGLPYGKPADPDPSNPVRFAIGPRPNEPEARTHYEQLAAGTPFPFFEV